ncbi:pseudouridine-5'-phosphate glycosidase [Candidatus Sumerlaeota bacterium]|nr:pseudouridine-5'-phosphate glycosidase [Candidatus Sumerlaeota bacterium]
MSRPRVALESTVISHGLPYPENVKVARALEQVVRDEGADPVTIAILDGKVLYGLNDEQLERLAREGKAVAKLNLSNLASGVASGRPGSTTVAATMFLAKDRGIRVFATGGIGGVHRGAETSFDISADMTALAQFPVAVVSAGAKAILDLPKTVEVLETMGVPVYGWQTDEFPSFYRRTSGLKVDARYDDMKEMARAIDQQWKMGLNAGVLVCNPIEAQYELEEGVYTRALGAALAEADAGKIGGRELTPFLLGRMEKLTAGQSVFSNVKLLENNARVAAQLAAALG